MKSILRKFDLMGDRYKYDAILKFKDGWRQYDTDADASYFGVWVNLTTWQVFTYVEGDTTMTTVTTEEEMKEELAILEDYYGPPPPAFKSLDKDGTWTHYYDKRPTL